VPKRPWQKAEKLPDSFDVGRFKMWSLDDGVSWWDVFSMAFPLLFFIVIVMLIVWGSRRYSGRSGSDKNPTPLEIAEARYARGEISREEFEQIRRDLA